jgi:RHS repeat-associated protein
MCSFNAVNGTGHVSDLAMEIKSNGNQMSKHIYMGTQRILSKLSDAGTMADPTKATMATYTGSTLKYATKYTTLTKTVKARYDSLGVAYNGVDNKGATFFKASLGGGLEGLYYYHSDQLGSVNYITDANGDVAQHLEYIPYGETFVDERYNTWHTPYLFSGKERDEETGLTYFGARYFDGNVWLSVDPLAEKNIGTSAYVYCAGNPLKFIDPTGMDTVNINKNDDGLWKVNNVIKSKGNDVFNVNDGKETSTFTFSEGEYGNRINYLRLEDDGYETFGVFHLSGTETTGYVVEPQGPETTKSGTNRRIPTADYNLTTSDVSGAKWRGAPTIYNDNISTGRGVKIHYGTGRIWSEACLVVSSDYTLSKSGHVQFKINESQGAAWQVNSYLGAASRDTKYINADGKNRHRYIYISTGKINSSHLGIKKI